MFKDRKDAGKKLAALLEKYKNKNVVVLAIPRGGVEVGFEVAKELNSDFSVLISRKLPYPDQPEGGFGAIAEDGSTSIVQRVEHILDTEVVEKIKEIQNGEIKRRVEKFRQGRPLPCMKGRTVILVDDGIAVGSTMSASALMCKNIGAKKIVVASPVASRDIESRFENLADEIIVVEQPFNFYAVAQVYENWYDVSDEEDLKLVK